MSRTFDEYSFRGDVHQLIAWGYHDAISDLNSGLCERDITHKFRLAIQSRLDDCATPSRFDVYAVHEDDPTKSGDGLLYIDLVFRRRERPRSLLFAFEAKRLNSKSHPISVYCGTDGLRCYLDDGGKYARDCTEAGMLGYIQTNDVAYWEKQLRKRLASDTALNVTKGLRNISILSELPHEWTSSHSRNSNSPITIFHIFLVCYN